MPIILGANTLSSGYDVANSVRFDDANNCQMRRAGVSGGNQDKFTLSMWIKRGNISTDHPRLFTSVASNDDRFEIYFENTDELHIEGVDNGTATLNLVTSRKFRDVSAWYHILLAVDTGQGTEANRAKLYINGVLETAFGTSTRPDQDGNIGINTDSFPIQIGERSGYGVDFDGYFAEIVFLDGTQAANTDFGEFDEDSPTIWKPIDVEGLSSSKGNNGFYLDFEASGNLGNDVFGGTDFSESGLSAYDQSTDTCTNNFATLNPLIPIVHTFEEGNLRLDGASDNWDSAFSTISASSGKWYFEMKFLALQGGVRRAAMGVVDARGSTVFATNEVGYNVTNAVGDSVGYNGNGTSNTIKKNDSAQYNGTEWAVNDIICMAVDLDNGAVYFRVNGGSFLNSGDPTSGSNRTGAVTLTTGESYVFGGTAYGATTEWQFNFGSPSYSESGGNSDGSGYGNFNQAVPSGYFSLNTKNLAQYG